MRRQQLALYGGAFVVALAAHLAAGLPFLLHGRELHEPPTLLVLQLQGVVAERQSEDKQLQKAEKAAPTDNPETPPPEPPPGPPVPQLTPVMKADEPAPAVVLPPKPKPKVESPRNVSGSKERETAQRIRETEEQRIRAYVSLLTKKVRENLVYPDDAQQAGLAGAAKVAFTILSNGEVRRESVRIVASSGEPKLDANALNTVLASAPFEAPPKEITVSMVISFGRKQ